MMLLTLAGYAYNLGMQPPASMPANARSVPAFMLEVARSPAPTFEKLIGQTPLIDLSSLSPHPDIRILGKCEFLNPSGSIKDRIVRAMLDDAESKGRIKPGDTIVAASSGNTGAALAMHAAMRGYKALIITDEKCSKEKKDALKAYGAELIVCKGGVPSTHPDHYQNVELRLCRENPSYFGLDQYNNPRNPRAHADTLAPEIWEQTGGEVTHFVAAASTGGTMSGTARALKELNPKIQTLLPDPHGSIFYEHWKSGITVSPRSFKIEGIGKDSIPGCMDFSLVDAVHQLTDADAFDMCKHLAQTEGLLVGGSAGANCFSAQQLARTIAGTGPATIVVVLCDHGIKYLSKIFNPEWREEQCPTGCEQHGRYSGPIYFRESAEADAAWSARVNRPASEGGAVRVSEEEADDAREKEMAVPAELKLPLRAQRSPAPGFSP